MSPITFILLPFFLLLFCIYPWYPVFYQGHLFFVSKDYLRDQKGYYLPLSQQEIARRGILLPTPELVDAIWDQATQKRIPLPLPTAGMTSKATIKQHSKAIGASYCTCGLAAGHKKDVVWIPNALPGRVAIYGWHTASGAPIQPLYQGHTDAYYDYSHGVRQVFFLVFSLSGPKLYTTWRLESKLHEGRSD